MKRILAVLLLASFVLVSCGKKGDPYPKRSLHDERVAEKKEQVK